MDHVLATECNFTAESTCTDDFAAVVFKVSMRRKTSIRVHKLVGYHYSENTTPEQMRSQTAWTLDHAIAKANPGTAACGGSRFWSHAEVTVDGADPRTQQVIRWNLFQLLQASERAEGHGIGARGLAGQSYESTISGTRKSMCCPS